MSIKINFNNMTKNEKLDFISERDGHINSNYIGVNSDGHEFRDDDGLALFIERDLSFGEFLRYVIYEL